MANETITFTNSKGEVKTRRAPVGQEAFIEAVYAAHAAGDGVNGVCERTGLTKGSVEARMTKYRTDKGIPLPTFAGGKGAPRMNVDKARELAARLSGKPLETIVAEGEALVAKSAARKAAKAAETASA